MSKFLILLKLWNEKKCAGMHLLSDQRRGGVTSCKCMDWGVADCRLAAISPDMKQHSLPWILHRWMSLLFWAYKKKTSELLVRLS